MKLANDRAQDLFLLAKNHYKTPKVQRIADVARRLIGLHNLYDPDRMPWRDAAHVVVGDLIESGALTMRPHKLADFLLSLGPHPGWAMLGPDHSQDGGYYAVLIERVLAELSATRVLDDQGKWLMPFAKPEIDPLVNAALGLLVEAEPA